jgi:hypothetical protein
MHRSRTLRKVEDDDWHMFVGLAHLNGRTLGEYFHELVHIAWEQTRQLNSLPRSPQIVDEEEQEEETEETERRRRDDRQATMPPRERMHTNIL